MGSENPFKDNQSEKEVKIAGARADGKAFAVKGGYISNASGEIEGLAVCLADGAYPVSAGQAAIFAPRGTEDHY